MVAVGLLLVSCTRQEPIRIGFLAGLSGKVADLGIGGRNGALLAVEQCNARGGVRGRPVELVVMDDGQDPDLARKAITGLLKDRIELIIGPMTSSMAMAVVPQVNGSQTILISPTVTTRELAGKDDNFLRVISVTADYAAKSARYQYEKVGTRSVAVICDMGNKSYTESWLDDFRRVFEGRGGIIRSIHPYQSGGSTIVQPLVRACLADRPDAVLVIGNSVDSALICQSLRKMKPGQRIIMSEWASTERFIELAGAAAEGVFVAQFLDRNDRSPRFLDFLKAYRQRFQQEPGFAGLAGYDAALVALDAYNTRRSAESLKSRILAQRSFAGVQQQLTLDRFGEADRKTYLTVVRDRTFVTLE
jgi:branched-chain amino acid transport system substrate-binding protein